MRCGHIPGPWLFGIATNLLRNHRRGEIRQLRAYARTGVDPVMQDWSSASDDRLDAQRAERALAGALATLRNDDRDVLLLFAWTSLSYRDIAVALGLPIGTVQSRLARARRQLREQLGAHGQVLDMAVEPGGAP